MKSLNFIVMLLFVSSVLSVTISGFISEAETGEKIPYATVVLNGTDNGCYANEEGYFVLKNVPKKDFEIFFSSMAHNPKKVDVHIKDDIDDQFLKIELEKQSINVEGIEVKEDRFKETQINPHQIILSRANIRNEVIQNIPEVADADVIRAIQVLPGVNSISDYSNGLYIRGGSPDQNLILLDNITVYNPNHLGGLFSTFNSDAISNVELIKGGIPVKYGGRLSSVLSISNLDGNRKHHQGIFRTSPVSTSTTLQGPWKMGTQKGSYMLSFRRTYIDLFRKLAKKMKHKNADDIPDYYFYDGHAKWNWDLNNKDKLTFSFYTGKDHFKEEDNNSLLLEWGNNTFSSRWIHVFSSQVFSKFVIAGSNFSSLLKWSNNSDIEYKRDNKIYDYSVLGALSYKPNEDHFLEFGFDAKFNKVKYFLEFTGDVDPDRFPQIDIKSFSSSIYLQDSWKFIDTWTLQPGLRISHFHSISDYLKDDPSVDYFRFSPRISLRKQLSEASNTYINFGRYYQYLTTLGMEEFAPLDVTLPIDKHLKPGLSDHYIAGYKTQLFGSHDLEIEGYYKRFKNIVTARAESSYEWDNETSTVEDLFNTGKGYALGLDFLVKTNWKGFEGFVAYGLGYTKRKTTGINTNPQTEEERYYFPKYDRTHSFTLIETYNLSQNTGFNLLNAEWEIGFSYKYATGQPFQKPERIYLDDDNIETFYSYKDRMRLPAYNRTDLSMKMKWYKKKYNIEFYAQVFNMFNNKNVNRIEYTETENSDGNVYFEKDNDEMIPILPFFGMNIEW